MEKTLTKAAHSMGVACDDLREALQKSNAVQAIVILSLIKQAAELRRDVEALLDAYVVDG